MLAGKTLGDDPAQAREKAKRATTFKDLVERYLAHQQGHLRPSTLDQSKRNLNKYASALHAKPVEAIDRATISGLRNNLTATAGPVQANRVVATLSAAFKWGMYEGLCECNPAALVPKNAESARERVLADAELAAIWRATESGDDYSRIVRLLMLTGCRREEIAGLRWAEVDGARLALPPSRTKTKVEHVVALAGLALAQLPERPNDDKPREFVFGKMDSGFSGWTRSKERLDAVVKRELGESGEKMPGWSLHDLRRTLATRLHEAGVAPHIVEAILAHAGAKLGIAGVYNRAGYDQPKREALALWARMVAAIVGETEPDNVVPFAKSVE